MSAKNTIVLIAESEPAMLSQIAGHMRNLGYTVMQASDGDVAWQLAKEHVPSLVILNVKMPGLSGLDVCERIKADASDGRVFTSTGVIILNDLGEDLSAVFPADAWLNLPLDLSALELKVRDTLAKYSK